MKNKETNVLVVIPARGGSKGIPLKNLESINGSTLTALAIRIAQKIPFNKTVLVSTDHKRIKEEALTNGAEVPFLRPESLSGDSISDYDVLIHSLEESEKFFQMNFEIIVMLQPTSPLRELKNITDCIDRLISDNLDAVWTVSPCDLKYHPKKQLYLNNSNLELVDPNGKEIIARQQLNTTYIRNGVCYAFSRNCILNQKTIYGKKTGAVIIHNKNISIDTIEDLEKARSLAKK